MRLGSVLVVVLLGLATLPSVFSADTQSVQSGEGQSVRKIVIKVVPVYPSTARSMSLTGTVKLEALVLANGTVKSIQVKGGNPLLAQAAQNAVREWKWAKAERESTEMLEFRFRP
ncbi:MAG: energy transducer TonB [Terriglobales bacterium]